MFSSLKKFFKSDIPKSAIPLSVEQVEAIKPGFKFKATWVCSTPVHPILDKEEVKLVIRSKVDRDKGDSNFNGLYPPYYPDPRYRGHSKVPSSELNWNGLAEERGWQVSPIVLCPVCLKAGAK